MNNKIIEYHVFTDSNDHWTKDLEEALIIAQNMYEENKCVRIYKEVYFKEEPISEDCIFALGNFPI